MEAGHSTAVADIERVGTGSDDDESRLPQAVLDAAKGVPDDQQSEKDATEWLLASDGPTEEETEPVTLKVNVGSPSKANVIDWKIVPLPDGEFKRFRRAAMGNRASRRRIAQGDPSGMDDFLYNRLVVAAATVSPDLKSAAAAKGVDVLDLLAHRFAAKPLLISQIAGAVSDISGGDEADVEVVAGN